MLRSERLWLDEVKTDKTFCHWRPILSAAFEAGGCKPTVIWKETDNALSRLKSVQIGREEELGLIYDDLLDKYHNEQIVITIFTVLFVRLCNAIESGEAVRKHRYGLLCRSLAMMLDRKKFFKVLLYAYFKNKKDACGNELIIPVSDELANAKDEIYDEEIKKDNNMDKEEKMNIARGMFEGADLSHAQIIAFAESGSKIVNQETIVNDEHQKHFPYLNSFDKGIRLFNMLVEGEFISKETESNSFLFLMGCSNEEPENLKPIMWMKTKQLLREMLEAAYCVPIEIGSVTKAELEQLVPLCFVDKNGEELNLAKPKAVPSRESDKLSNFFATFSDPNSKD